MQAAETKGPKYVDASKLYKHEGEDSGTDSGTGTMRAVSLMLVGSVVFQLSLFYFSNHSDVGIRHYTWHIIGTTVSIFCAVLVFEAHEELVTALVIEAHEDWEILVHFIHLFFWLAIMQFSAAFFSGSVFSLHQFSAAFSGFHTPVFVAPAQGSEEHMKEVEESRKLNLKASGEILSHLSGFAAIRVWGEVQHHAWFKASPAHAAIVILLALVALYAMFRVFRAIRIAVRWREDEEWEEQAIEAENDVIALVCSFLITQCTRYVVSGTLPNVEGRMVETGASLVLECQTMIFFLCFWLVVSYILVELRERDAVKEHPRGLRVVNMTLSLSFMCISWKMLFAAKSLLRWMAWFENDEGIIAGITLAFFLCAILMGLIILLDEFSDRIFTGQQADYMVKLLIGAFALCIGFAWEKCFDVALENMVEMAVEYAEVFGKKGIEIILLKYVGTLLLVALVTPAYRWYILPEDERTNEIKVKADELKWHAHGDKHIRYSHPAAQAEALQHPGNVPAVPPLEGLRQRRTIDTPRGAPGGAEPDERVSGD